MFSLKSTCQMVFRGAFGSSAQAIAPQYPPLENIGVHMPLLYRATTTSVAPGDGCSKIPLVIRTNLSFGAQSIGCHFMLFFFVLNYVQLSHTSASSGAMATAIVTAGACTVVC